MNSIEHRHLTAIPGWTIVEDSCATAEWRELWRHPSGGTIISAAADDSKAETFSVEFRNVARFEIRFASRSIALRTLGADISDATLNHLLVDQLWPLILAQGGALVLHGAGVATPRGAILLIGPSGRGKSTLAASLHQRGFALLGDDAMVIDAEDPAARCRAVYPSMRLFPDSIGELFGATIGHSAVAHYTDKRNLDLAATAAASDQWHDLRAIFFLAEEDDKARIEAERLGPAVACMQMIEYSFWLDPTDVALTAAKLRAAAATAATTPAFALRFPRAFARLDEVHAALFAALA